MPFRNSVISAVIATALTGRRIVIDALTSFGSVIEFWVGQGQPANTAAPETHPSRLRVVLESTVPYRRYLRINGPGTPAQFIALGTGDDGNSFMTVDVESGQLDLNARRVSLRQGLLGADVDFSLDTFNWNNRDQLSRVTSWTPAVTSDGTVNMGASPVRQGDYLISGRNVRGNAYVAFGAGAGATGTVVFLELPLVPDSSYFNRCIGSGVLFFAGNWYDGSIFSVASADGARARFVANNVLQAPAMVGAGNVVSWQFDYLSA